jgi:hypothetical protein
MTFDHSSATLDAFSSHDTGPVPNAARRKLFAATAPWIHVSAHLPLGVPLGVPAGGSAGGDVFGGEGGGFGSGGAAQPSNVAQGCDIPFPAEIKLVFFNVLEKNEKRPQQWEDVSCPYTTWARVVLRGQKCSIATPPNPLEKSEDTGFVGHLAQEHFRSVDINDKWLQDLQVHYHSLAKD